MSTVEFLAELDALGYEAKDLGDGRVAINYRIRLGRFAGRDVRLGFQQTETFPLNPPNTPHVAPRLLPLHPSQDVPHPDGGVHPSAFGDDWEYWSRPIADWAQEPSARHLLRHISDLFAKIP